MPGWKDPALRLNLKRGEKQIPRCVPRPHTPRERQPRGASLGMTARGAQIHSQHVFELGLGIVAGERMLGWKDPALRLNLKRGEKQIPRCVPRPQTPRERQTARDFARDDSAWCADSPAACI